MRSGLDGAALGLYIVGKSDVVFVGETLTWTQNREAATMRRGKVIGPT